MDASLHICLVILCLFYGIGCTWAEPSIPPFTEPEIRDPALGKWFYIVNTKQTNIELREEVSRQVLIAEINYTAEKKPEIGSFRSPNNNYLLGAEIKKNGTEKWGIYITKKQDYETEIMRQYKFEVVIGSANFGVTLNILNIDDNAPIIQPNERNCAVKENYFGGTNCSYTIHDADGWIDQVNVTFKSMPEEGWNNFAFRLEPANATERNYSMTAYLNVIQSLNFEEITMYMLTMTATDAAGNATSITIPVEVLDMPDELPKWTRLAASETLKEKSTKMIAVAAIDGDIRINAEINYKLILAEGEETLFTIDTTTGGITIQAIDRDTLKKEVFRLQVIAYEKENVSSEIQATIIVIVEDINDHIPEISSETLSIDIDEETYLTLDFPQPITISDTDLAESAQYHVYLVDDSGYNWSSAFSIVPNNGYQTNNFTISVVNASLLDYEDENWRHIRIKLQSIEVANKFHVDERNIEINLRNWNDEWPVFENDMVEVSVPEDVDMGFHIATILATDRDINDTVTHSLVAQNGLNMNESTGIIVTSHNDVFDFESIPIIVVQIVATDFAKHKTYATLAINVIDVNDVPPSLNLPRITPSLVEEIERGTEVAVEIEAVDKDTAAQLVFSIDWSMTIARKMGVIVNDTFYHHFFEINTRYPANNTRFAQGTLVVKGRIDYEAFDVILISVVVTDVTTVHNNNSTSASITLNIIDINDNSPIFDPYEPMSVSENQLTDTLIGAITATDADGPLNNQVSYYIVPINDTEDDLVQINKNTGSIRVKKDRAIDAETYERIYYNVIATDNDNNATILLPIYVIDINDEVPYLLNEFNTVIHLPEKSRNGTVLGKLSGGDNDRTDPYNNVSYLINANYSAPFQYFSLGRYDGLLQVNLADDRVLDRDFVAPNYTLNLKLRDNYLNNGVTWNSNTFDMVVTVILDDINDQKPILPNRSDPVVEIGEFTNASVLIISITAEDHDDPATNNTKVDYKLLNTTLIDHGIVPKLSEQCKNLFEVMTIDAKHAQIYTTQELRGCCGTWAIQLYAQDRGTNPTSLNDTKTYNIRIKDYNFYEPMIVFPEHQKNIALTQDQSLHTQLKTYDMDLLKDFSATDDDCGASGQVKLSISSEDNAHQYFELISTHANSAKLQLRSWPDFDQQNRFKLIVTATDAGIPAKNISLEVTIIFVSAPDPEFDASEWTIWVKENKTSLSFSQLIPAARDDINENGGNIIIYYFIDKKVGDYEFFGLDNFTRELTIIKELDREKQEMMQILVIATADKNGPSREPKKKATLNITIIVLDENDNGPIFELDVYSAGVAREDKVDHIIMTVKAIDADLNDTLTYSIIAESMVTSDISLAGIRNPFYLMSDTGELSLKFSALSDMRGFFSFRIIVHDAANHSDSAGIQIYIVSQSNRVAFKFNNSPAYVKTEKMFLMKTFSQIFGHTCDVDDIKSSFDSENHVLDNSTTLISHFIDSRNSLPIASDVIILASSDLQTVTNLKARLETRFLYLIDVPTGSAIVTENIQQIIQWVFICLTIFSSLLCVAMIVAYFMRSRSLLRRIDRMAIGKGFEVQETEQGRGYIAPTTNHFAIAGSNPIWSTTRKFEENSDDYVRETSRISDLICIENNSNFNYKNRDKIMGARMDFIEHDDDHDEVVGIEFYNPYFEEKKHSADEDTC